MTPDALAKACAQAMWREDAASQGLGMSLESVAAGCAVVSMVVTRAMTNGLRTCHGGFLFTLADSAFAFACNTYNLRTVAQMAQITFLAPAHEGDRLTARAEEVWRQGRGGLYDICVTNQHDIRIAEFRGHSRVIKGQHLPDLP